MVRVIVFFFSVSFCVCVCVSLPPSQIRRLYSWWSTVQFQWKETGYDPDFIGDPKADRGPIRGTYSHPGPFDQQQEEE